MKPILLDLFCGAGGCTKGYQQGGFYVVGVDDRAQPHYCGDEFYQYDAFEFLEARDTMPFAVVHASPPCQRYSIETPPDCRARHPDWIARTRYALIKTGKPFVIENVENARKLLINPIMLCGSMFDLKVWRHRYFEMSPRPFVLTPPCNHSFDPILITGSPRRHGSRIEPSTQERRDASELYWMTRKEMDEAIPPAYTRFISHYLLAPLIH